MRPPSASWTKLKCSASESDNNMIIFFQHAYAIATIAYQITLLSRMSSVFPILQSYLFFLYQGELIGVKMFTQPSIDHSLKPIGLFLPYFPTTTSIERRHTKCMYSFVLTIRMMPGNFDFTSLTSLGCTYLRSQFWRLAQSESELTKIEIIEGKTHH